MNLSNLDITENYIDNTILPRLCWETCKKLDSANDELLNISWHSGESNTDIPFSNLAKKYCLISFSEINKDQKLKIEIGVPDLNIKFKHNNKTYEKKIELKSSKNTNSIPGSMIRSLDPNIWTIFCFRDEINKKFEVRYGRYFKGLQPSKFEKFQDRSPRPSLNFKNFQKSSEKPDIEEIDDFTDNFWKHYANCAINRVLEPQSHSWQDDMVKEIIRLVLKDPNKFKNI